MEAYAGIGSRETPDNMLDMMRNLGIMFGELRYILRSGGAPGADVAFESGCDSVGGTKEIFIPWDGFNNHSRLSRGMFVGALGEAYDIAEQHHPGWQYLKSPARTLMARNVHQVLGPDLKTPCNFIVCWTKNGSLTGRERETGGTGQAIRIAYYYDIPVYNLYREEHYELMLNYLNEFGIVS